LMGQARKYLSAAKQRDPDSQKYLMLSEMSKEIAAKNGAR